MLPVNEKVNSHTVINQLHEYFFQILLYLASGIQKEKKCGKVALTYKKVWYYFLISTQWNTNDLISQRSICDLAVLYLLGTISRWNSWAVLLTNGQNGWIMERQSEWDDFLTEMFNTRLWFLNCRNCYLWL